MFSATNIVNSGDKNVYSDSGIAFDGARSWSFGDGFARNVVIFGVNNSSSSHIDNLNNFLILRKGPTDNINSASVQQKKNV